MKKTGQTTSPEKSGAVLELLSICRKIEINDEEIKDLLYLINAPADVYGIIRVCNNIVDIHSAIINHVSKINNNAIKYDYFDIEFNETKKLAKIAKKILDNKHYIVSSCGYNFNEEHAGNIHPMRGNLYRNALYAMIWVRPNKIMIDHTINEKYAQFKNVNSNELIARYQILQGIVMQICIDIISKNIDRDTYWFHDDVESILGGHNQTINNVCTKIRQLAGDDKIYRITNRDITLPKNDFISFFAKSSYKSLIDELKPIKTLSTKVLKNTSRLRDYRERKTSVYWHRKYNAPHVEYGSRMRIKKLNNERLSTREIDVYNPSANWINSGLPPDEAVNDDDVHVLLTRSCDNRDEKRQILDAVSRANHMSMQNQRFYGVGNYITSAEFKHWYTRIEAAWTSDDTSNEQRIALAFSSVAVWVGVDHQVLKKLYICNSMNNLPEKFKCAYVIEQAIMFVHIDIPRLKKPNPEFYSQDNKKYSNHVAVNCGHEVSRKLELISKIIHLDEVGISQPFDKKSRKYTKYHNNLFINDRNNRGYNITLARMASVVFNHMVLQSDPVFAMYVTSKVDSRLIVSSHYACPTLQEVNRAYQIVRGRLLHKCDIVNSPCRYKLPDELSGLRSGLTDTPSIDEVKNLIMSIKDKMKTADNKIDYHNWFTLYVAVCICFTTGYRAVRDIDLGPNCRIERILTAFIRDKDDHENTRTRRMLLTKALLILLHKYEDAIKHIRSTHELYFSNITASNLGYLFFVDESNSCIGFTPSHAESMLRELGYHHKMNASRKFIRSHMIRSGIKVDYIDTFMGHANFGRESNNRYSCLSPHKWKNKLYPVLENIALQIEITEEEYRHDL